MADLAQFKYCVLTLDPEDRTTAGLDTLILVDHDEAALIFM